MHKVSAYLLQFPHDILRVVERSYLLVAMAINNGHSLQAHGFHGCLRGKQKPVVEVVEELLPARRVRGVAEEEEGMRQRREKRVCGIGGGVIVTYGFTNLVFSPPSSSKRRR